MDCGGWMVGEEEERDGETDGEMDGTWAESRYMVKEQMIDA